MLIKTVILSLKIRKIF